jgi:hypothetical protein
MAGEATEQTIGGVDPTCLAILRNPPIRLDRYGLLKPQGQRDEV